MASKTGRLPKESDKLQGLKPYHVLGRRIIILAVDLYQGPVF